MNAVHPDHWFQGEYDLVYRWTGAPVIVDLKASVGANDRSGDYVEQLKIYAMLWHATHDYDQRVEGLQNLVPRPSKHQNGPRAECGANGGHRGEHGSVVASSKGGNTNLGRLPIRPSPR